MDSPPQVVSGTADPARRIGCSRVFGLRSARDVRARMESARQGQTFKRAMHLPRIVTGLSAPGTDTLAIKPLLGPLHGRSVAGDLLEQFAKARSRSAIGRSALVIDGKLR